ncbi:MAG: ABC transporter permease [Gammaproteobacteria bacterium]
MKSLRRILAIVRKEARQLSRDRLTFGMIVGIPLLQIVLFGYAINTDVRDLRGGIADQARTQLSRRLVADIQASQVIEFLQVADGPGELEAMMRRGEIAVAVVIPHDFERRLLDRDRPAAQLLVDGSDPSIAGVARRLREMPFVAREAAGREDHGLFELRNYYNPERRSAVQIVPALIGVILNLTMVLFTAVAIVRERERGNLELLITTPIRNTELMAGKILPYILIGLAQVSIILITGMVLFDVPVFGSLWDLYAASLVFIAATLGLGLVISTFAQTQFQAMQLTVFTFLPSILLSGFMFPFDGMPPPAQWVGNLLPLTHFVVMVRGIVLRGATLSDLTPSLQALGIFFAVTMSAAILRFRKRLD